VPNRPAAPCRDPVCPNLDPCPLHGPATRPYGQARGSSTQQGYGAIWRRLRREHLRMEPLCRTCAGRGRVVLATDVDHVIPRRQGGRDEHANLQSLCHPCHSAKTAREAHPGGFGKTVATSREQSLAPYTASQAGRLPPLPALAPSRVPLTIVCGPPGAGKSTYVREHATPADLVVDLDEIRSELSGQPLYAAGPETLVPAILERNRRLQGLAVGAEAAAAWFVVGAPSRRERDHWRRLRPHRVVMLATSPEECRRRLAADARRGGCRSELERAVDEWWRRFEPDPRDLHPGSRARILVG
jgi:AAA domain-containing protein/HNH endonuclease